jgi:hypothetical protein
MAKRKVIRNEWWGDLGFVEDEEGKWWTCYWKDEELSRVQLKFRRDKRISAHFRALNAQIYDRPPQPVPRMPT